MFSSRPNRQKLPKGLIAVFIFLFLSVVILFADLWYIGTYGRINFDSILFTLTADLSGTSSTLFWRYMLQSLLPAVLVSSALVWLSCWLLRSRKVKTWLISTVLCAMGLGVIVFAAFDSQLVEYLVNTNTPSTLYETEYHDPADTSITFPEEKQNLVYIMLESMEVSFLSEEKGGALAYDLIPELYALAQENINFSHNGSVGGFRPSTGATWTIGSMVSQTAGIPLAPVRGGADEAEQGHYGGEDTFLPGAVTLMDILHENGYYQALMVGSVAAFGDRSVYYSTHGVDKIYDIATAQADGIVPPDYWDGWWGMEDFHLFEYAKQELTALSQQEQPFAFTMLTVDTHHVDGHPCPYCGDEYEEQYDNVIRCSSRQVADFVQWLQQQPFYENTTVIIVGDHCSMDAGYFDRNVEEDYVRRVYNCILNSAVETAHSKNRAFCTLDLFPTTLAALGCRIEGDRLGLGTNLFSGVPTLMEQWGYDQLCDKLYGHRDYYAEKFMNILP